MAATTAAVTHCPRNRHEYENLLVSLLEQSDSDPAVSIDISELSLTEQQEAKQSLFSILTNRVTITYSPLISNLVLDVCSMASEDDLVRDTGSFTLMLQYLRTVPTLHELTLGANDETRIAPRYLLEHLAQAIAANPNLTRFCCFFSPSHLALPASVVRTATNVQSLSLYFEDFDEPYTAHHESIMANAFGENRSVQAFILYFYDNSDLVASILPALAANPNLKLFILGTTLEEGPPLSTAHYDALTQFVGSIQAAAAEGAISLKKIQFIHYPFRNQAAGRLLDAMSTVSTFTWLFNDCDFCPVSAERFVDFVQSIGPDHDVTISIGSCSTFQDRTVGNVLSNRTVGNVLSEALPGSRLSHLQLSGESAEVFHGLEANYRTVWLYSLYLVCLMAEELDSFASFLKTTRLRALHIQKLANGVDHRQLIKAIRKNGSLIVVKIPALDGSEHKAALEHITARNENVPVLLNVAVVTEEDDEDDDRPTVVSHLPRFPPLFCAAQKAPHMAPNNVLIGLLAADEASGMVPMGW